MNAPDQRVPRLLAMVPYFLAHPDVRTEDAARDFGITEAQLIKDLNLLWVCGLPGQGPGDLIDLTYEGNRVSITYDAGIRRPLRLTAEEALALTVALRALAETPGLTDADAVRRALAKVETAAGGAVDPGTVAVELDRVAVLQAQVQGAVDEHRALRLRYYTAARDETTDRVVDPLQLFQADGHAYLEAWCRRAEGVRVFRIDRIDSAEMLDEPARPPADVTSRDISEGVFTPSNEHLLVVLRLEPSYAWVADYYPVEEARQVGDAVRVSMRVSEPALVQALVLGAAGQIRVLSPQWLAESIRAEAATAVASYAAT